MHGQCPGWQWQDSGAGVDSFRASLNSAHVVQMTSLVSISKVTGVVLPNNGTHLIFWVGGGLGLAMIYFFLKKKAGLGLFLDLLEDRNLEHSHFSVLLCKLRRLKNCFVLDAGICLSHGEQKVQPFEKQQSCSVEVPSLCRGSVGSVPPSSLLQRGPSIC